ncbi:hypothetical protein D3C80_1677170 [compost metagenome]
MELHFHSAHFIGIDFLTGRANDNGGLWAGNRGLEQVHLRTEFDLFPYAIKLITVASLASRGVIVAATVLDVHHQELPVIGRTPVMFVMLRQLKRMARTHSATVT